VNRDASNQPNGEPERENQPGAPDLESTYFSQWTQREVPADQIFRSLSREHRDEYGLAIEQAVLKVLRAELIRRFHAVSDSFDPLNPAEARLRLSGVIIPSTLPKVHGSVPNAFVQPRFSFPRGYGICCQFRNREGESVVYLPESGHGFAFSSELPGEKERPTAVSRVFVHLRDGDRERFLVDPSKFPLGHETFTNRAGHLEQLGLIQDEKVLRPPNSRFEPPMWSKVRAALVGVFQDEGARNSTVIVNSIRPFPYAMRPGELVCETNFGSAWVGCRWMEYLGGGFTTQVSAMREQERIRGLGYR